jgi:hypothetical protein
VGGSFLIFFFIYWFELQVGFYRHYSELLRVLVDIRVL